MDTDSSKPNAVTPRYRKRGRPRKDESFNVIDGGFVGVPKRPDPPSDLTTIQRAHWKRIVASEPIDFFGSEAVRDILRDLVCHRSEIERLTTVIDAFKPEWLKNAEGMKRYTEYLKLRQKETASASLMATRLRLTNQSRYTPTAAATAGRNQAKVRPWEEE